VGSATVASSKVEGFSDKTTTDNSPLADSETASGNDSEGRSLGMGKINNTPWAVKERNKTTKERMVALLGGDVDANDRCKLLIPCQCLLRFSRCPLPLVQPT
jgi:hypothetical protein